MRIHSQTVDGGVLLELEGRLDGASARQLENEINAAIQAGSRNVDLDMRGVDYLTSVGIRVLLSAGKKLKSGAGRLAVRQPSSMVQEILAGLHLDDLVAVDPAPGPAAGAPDPSGLEILRQQADAGCTCEVFGHPERIFSGVYTESDARVVRVEPACHMVGVAALGTVYAECRARFGESIVLAGIAASLTPDQNYQPDYVMADYDYVPAILALYGLRCTATEPHGMQARLAADKTGAPSALSGFLAAALAASGARRAWVTLLAESAGLLGANLLRSPALKGDAQNILDFPWIRDWISVTVEPVYRDRLVVISGAIAAGDDPELRESLRPLGDGLVGRLTAAVFKYRLLPAVIPAPADAVRDLFQTGRLLTVLHLLGNEGLAPAGAQSRLRRGHLWLTPITRVTRT